RLGDSNHTGRRLVARLGGRNLDQMLGQEMPLVRKSLERLTREFMHFVKQAVEHQRVALARVEREDRSVAVGFHLKTERRPFARHFWLKFFTMPKVVIFHSSLKPHAQLVAAKVEFIAIDERPERPAAAWEFARESSPLERRRVRLPARAREETRERPFDPGNSIERLGIAVVHAVPDSSDVLSAFVRDAVQQH